MMVIQIGQWYWQFQLVSGEAVKADERYFSVRVQHNPISEDGQQTLERRYMKRYRWWSTAALKSTSDTVYRRNFLTFFKKISTAEKTKVGEPVSRSGGSIGFIFYGHSSVLIRLYCAGNQKMIYCRIFSNRLSSVFFADSSSIGRFNFGTT